MTNELGPTDQPPESVIHALFQAMNGEFAIYAEEAATMTADQFAEKYGATLVEGGYLDKVVYDGCEYFWDSATGKFDGWGKAMRAEND